MGDGEIGEMGAASASGWVCVIGCLFGRFRRALATVVDPSSVW